MNFNEEMSVIVSYYVAIRIIMNNELLRVFMYLMPIVLFFLIHRIAWTLLLSYSDQTDHDPKEINQLVPYAHVV
jgi:hypothetical protein